MSCELLSRFLAKVSKTESCWLWCAWSTPAGYGMIKIAGRTAQAHRVSYELHVGPIPEGHEIDHLCRNRGCVNPAHLEPVTHAENQRRSAVARGVRCEAPTPALAVDDIGGAS